MRLGTGGIDIFIKEVRKEMTSKSRSAWQSAGLWFQKPMEDVVQIALETTFTNRYRPTLRRTHRKQINNNAR
jgi:hypothetical protein